MAFETRLFINNQFVPATSGKEFDVRSPRDNSVIATVQEAGAADIDVAYAAAKDALYSGPWSTMRGQDRAACMNKLADLMVQNAEELALAETSAMGMPRLLSTALVTHVTAPIWRYYAGWCDKLGGESFPTDGDGLYKIVQYEPIGVCAAISAWNGTTLSIAWKVAAAVAAGNTMIHKTSEKSPLGALVMGRLVVEAGFPPGVINFVSGAGNTGALLASHMKIAKISFTGSTASGRKVQEAATKSNMKRVTLELGGKSPSIVFDDANMENALVHNSQSFLTNSGQACTAGSRIFVQEGVAENFIEQLKARFESWGATMDDPMDAKTFLGPVADKFQFDRVQGMIRDGIQDGGDVITGGSQHSKGGLFIKPTIFLNPSPENGIYRDEIFGPVLSINTFKTEEEVIERANDTPYGLSSYLFTSDISRALRVARKIEAGMVNINTTQNIINTTPFGGVKESGTGRESGKHGLMAYLNVKTITIKVNEL